MFFHNNAILSAPVKTTHKLLMNFFLKRGPTETGRRKKVIERSLEKKINFLYYQIAYGLKTSLL